VILPEIGDHVASSAIEKMRPHAMKAIGGSKKSNDLQHTIRALLSRDEAALNAHQQGHQAETGRAYCDEVFVSGRDLQRHAGVWVCALPVVPKAALLDH